MNKNLRERKLEIKEIKKKTRNKEIDKVDVCIGHISTLYGGF